MNGQFKPLHGNLAEEKITLEVCSNNEHVAEIKRQNRTVKERVRAVYNTLPFKKVPGRILVELVNFVVFWLNVFLPSAGVSKTLSPRTIITGLEVDYDKYYQLEFGKYVQTHEVHNNSMATGTTGAIALRPTGNSQGGYFSSA
eukprot:3516129-Ditylum_brightwellii.AAC.1